MRKQEQIMFVTCTGPGRPLLSPLVLFWIFSFLLTLNSLAASPVSSLSLLSASISCLSLSLSLCFSHSGSWARIYRERRSNWTAVHSPIKELGSWGLNLSQREQQFNISSLPSSLLSCSLPLSSLLNDICLTSLHCFYFGFNERRLRNNSALSVSLLGLVRRSDASYHSNDSSSVPNWDLLHFACQSIAWHCSAFTPCHSLNVLLLCRQCAALASLRSKKQDI